MPSKFQSSDALAELQTIVNLGVCSILLSVPQLPWHSCVLQEPWISILRSRGHTSSLLGDVLTSEELEWLEDRSGSHWLRVGSP